MNKKQRFIEEGVALATEAKALYVALQEYNATYFANGYNSGGAAEIVDGDFTGQTNIEHLNAAGHTALITALQALETTFEANGNITAIRQAEYGGQ